MFAAMAVLFLLPLLDKHKVRSAQFRPYYKQFYWLFFLDCMILGWVGAMPARYLRYNITGRFYLLFAFFLIIMPLLSGFEKVGDLPSSISSAVLSEKFDKGSKAMQNRFFRLFYSQCNDFHTCLSLRRNK